MELAKKTVWVDPTAVERLREARELSQAELAASAGVGQTTVSRMGRVDGPFTRVNVAKIAQALGVPMAEIVKTPVGDGSVGENDREVAAVDLSALSDEGRRQVRAYLRFVVEQERKGRAHTPGQGGRGTAAAV